MMIELTETIVTIGVAGFGVVATIGWYVLAWYGIETLRDVYEAVEESPK